MLHYITFAYYILNFIDILYFSHTLVADIVLLNPTRVWSFSSYQGRVEGGGDYAKMFQDVKMTFSFFYKFKHNTHLLVNFRGLLAFYERLYSMFLHLFLYFSKNKNLK